MTYTVYGVRLRGDREVRYVGQSIYPPETRLNGLYGNHSSKRGGNWHGNTFGQWLIENRDMIEAFEIARCDSREDALATENVVIAICLRFNHRLFNGHQVPNHLRIVRGRFQPLDVAA
jgi:hypothetical protein